MGELAERDFVVREMFGQFDLDRTGELNAVQLQALHAELRIGGISLPQVTISDIINIKFYRFA